MDGVQPPRYTSTPRAERNTFALLNNFNDVSPIFPTPDIVRKVKSMIPVSTTNQIRSSGVQSSETKTKNSMSTNNTGQGSSGSVKIPRQIPKPGAEKKNTNNSQGPTRSVQHVLPQVAKTALPSAQPNSDVKVPTKSTMKSKVPKAPLEREAPNSTNEGPVIASLLPSSSNMGHATTTSTITTSGDDSRSKSNRTSKILKRPSTLSSVPEEGLNGGTAELSEDCILKKQTPGSNWEIPKETKNKVSLKRKSSVPSTVSKRNKKTKTNSEQDDESVFDSPDLPNLAEISSLCNKRQTYLVKKKPEMTDIEEERHENVTDGIIPLENPSINASVKITPEGLKNTKRETGTRKGVKISKKSVSKNKLEEVNDKENVEQGNSTPPVVRVYKGKRTLIEQSDHLLEENPNIESNVRTESVENIVAEPSKPSELTEQLVQNKIDSIISEERLKVHEVKINDHHSETKKGSKNPEKKDTIPNQDLNTESSKTKTIVKRTLRERKPNVKYEDTIDNIEKVPKTSKKKKEATIKSSQEQNENLHELPAHNIEKVTKTIKKKKEATIKSSQEQNENLHELPAQSKLERKKTVKGSKKPSRVNSVSDELPLCQQDEVLKVKRKDAKDAGTSNKSKSQKSKKCIEKEEEITSTHEPGNNEDECIGKGKTKGLGANKRIKNVVSTDSEIPDEEEEEHIPLLNIHAESDNQQNNHCLESKPSETDGAAISMLNTGSKSQPKRPTSTIQIETNQTNEVSVPMTSHGESSSKCSKSNKNECSTLSETKNKCKTVQKNSTVTEFVEEIEKTTKKPVHKVKGQSILKKKESGVCEQSRDGEMQKNRNTLSDKSAEGEEICLSFTGKKRKTEDMECGPSHSGSSPKRQRCGDINSEKVSDPPTRFHKFDIKDLFGTNEVKKQQVQPGVVLYKAIHIHDFVMAGEVHIEPETTISKISTNTVYRVLQGTAKVRIGKRVKTYSADGDHQRFFIPKSIDMAITNIGNETLKMDFSKFKG